MSELTTTANERMSIVDACNEVGMDVFSNAGNYKFHCPFGHLYHKDGGHAKSFRLYEDSNSAYCFACPMYFTPSKLIALDRDVSEDEAAQIILETTGYVAPALEDRWESARTVVQPPVDTSGLATALATYCRRIDPLWDVTQFDEPQATVFRRCVELTDTVRTEEDVTLWLEKTKAAMSKLLLDKHV